jgi:hypothetical protein
VTWQPDEAISDVFSPLPVHRDGGIQPCYAGDYDYATANQISGHHYTTWTDGRVIINGEGNQDVWFDRMLGVGGTPTNTPTGTLPTSTRTSTATSTPTRTATTDPCLVQNYLVASATGTVITGTNLLAGSNCDDCFVNVALPFPVRLYGVTYNSLNAISNGNVQFTTTNTTFTNTCLPSATHGAAIMPYWDDLLLTGAGQGIYTATLGTAPNRTFVIEWRGGYFSG